MSEDTKTLQEHLNERVVRRLEDELSAARQVADDRLKCIGVLSSALIEAGVEPGHVGAVLKAYAAVSE